MTELTPVRSTAAARQVTVEILHNATSRARLTSLAEAQFGDVVKARSRSDEDGALRDLIREIVTALVKDAPPG